MFDGVLNTPPGVQENDCLSKCSIVKYSKQV